MLYYQKFAIIGFIIGLAAIIAGILGLTTSNWISINYNQSSSLIVYDLFRVYRNGTYDSNIMESFRISQIFEITGCITMTLGIFLGVLCTALVNQRTIHFMPPILIMMGTISIFIGFIFYMKNLVEMNQSSTITEINFGYSMILMIVASVIGCIVTVYFSYTAGYMHRHLLSTIKIY